MEPFFLFLKNLIGLYFISPAGQGFLFLFFFFNFVISKVLRKFPQKIAKIVEFALETPPPISQLLFSKKGLNLSPKKINWRGGGG